MQVLELLNLTFWIDENIKKNAVAQKYQKITIYTTTKCYH